MKFVLVKPEVIQSEIYVRCLFIRNALNDVEALEIFNKISGNKCQFNDVDVYSDF